MDVNRPRFHSNEVVILERGQLAGDLSNAKLSIRYRKASWHLRVPGWNCRRYAVQRGATESLLILCDLAFDRLPGGRTFGLIEERGDRCQKQRYDWRGASL
jgi:hypothetical protein